MARGSLGRIRQAKTARLMVEKSWQSKLQLTWWARLVREGFVRSNSLSCMMISSFQVGQSHKISVPINVGDAEHFVSLSGDAAPLHTDADFARKAYDGPVVHGAFLNALVSRLVGIFQAPAPCWNASTFRSENHAMHLAKWS